MTHLLKLCSSCALPGLLCAGLITRLNGANGFAGFVCLKASITVQNAIQVPNNRDPMYKARKLLHMQMHGFRFNLNGLGKADRGMQDEVLFQGVSGCFTWFKSKLAVPIRQYLVGMHGMAFVLFSVMSAFDRVYCVWVESDSGVGGPH